MHLSRRDCVIMIASRDASWYVYILGLLLAKQCIYHLWNKIKKSQMCEHFQLWLLHLLAIDDRKNVQRIDVFWWIWWRLKKKESDAVLASSGIVWNKVVVKEFFWIFLLIMKTITSRSVKPKESMHCIQCLFL